MSNSNPTPAKMPITCYLRHFSSVGMEAAQDQPEEVRFFSGEPLSEEEAQIARAAGVTTLEIHGAGWGIAPAVAEVEPGCFNLAYLEQQAALVRSYGMAPSVSPHGCLSFILIHNRKRKTPHEYQPERS